MKRPAIAILALFGLAVAVFFPALRGDYLYWDDSTHLLNNPRLAAGDWLFFWREPFYRLYLPMTYTAWTAVMAVSKSPVVLHVFNFSIHLLNALLVWRLTRIAFPRLSLVGVWAAVAVFLVHPLQIEPAGWISGARDTISSFFALAAACVLWGSDRRPWGTSAVSVGLFALGLLAKATIAPFPVAILALGELRRRLNKARLVALTVWLLLGAVILGINKVVQQAEADRMVVPMELWKRLVIAGDTIGFYTMKFLVPYPLAGDYGRIPVEIWSRQAFWGPIAVLFLVAGVLGFLFYRKVRLPFDSLLYSVLVLGPVLGIIPFMAQAQSTVADRYMYLAILGPAWMVGSAVDLRSWGIKVFLSVLMIWSAIGFSRARVWENNFTFFTDMLDYNPDAFGGHTTMGAVQYIAGRLDLAEAHFRRAIQINPKNISPLANLAEVFRQQNRWGDVRMEIMPVVIDPDFIKQNDNNLEAVARCIRVVALSHIATTEYALANDRFCQALQLDPNSQAVIEDFAYYQREMAILNFPVRPCN